VAICLLRTDRFRAGQISDSQHRCILY